MVTTNGGPLRAAPDTTVVFTPSTITIAVGETVTINYSSGMAAPSASTLDALFGGIATTEVTGSVTGTVMISGVSTGTATIAPSTSLGNGVTMGYDGFSLTVTAPADDQNFLNERGLAHFWDNISSAISTKISTGNVQTSDIYNSAVTTVKVADEAITTAKIATSIAWTSGTYASGYKASSNTAYMQGIQACIYNGFLIVRFGVSKTSGNFAANTEVGVGSIPSTINGVDISSLASGGKQNLYRTSVSGSGGAIGFGQFNGVGISVCPTTTATWLAGQFVIPLNW